MSIPWVSAEQWLRDTPVGSWLVFFSSLYILEIISLYLQYFILLPFIYYEIYVLLAFYIVQHHLLYNGESPFLNQPGFPIWGWDWGYKSQIGKLKAGGTQGRDPWGTPRVMWGTNKAFGKSVREKKEVLMVMCVYIICLLVSHIWSYVYMFIHIQPIYYINLY